MIKNKLYLLLSILLITISLICLVYFGVKDKEIGILAWILVMMVGFVMLNHWSSISYKWKCGSCGYDKQITAKENFCGINSGVNEKSLYCPVCKEKRVFKGEYIFK